jgi:hypothetical protein
MQAGTPALRDAKAVKIPNLKIQNAKQITKFEAPKIGSIRLLNFGIRICFGFFEDSDLEFSHRAGCTLRLCLISCLHIPSCWPTRGDLTSQQTG